MTPENIPQLQPPGHQLQPPGHELQPPGHGLPFWQIMSYRYYIFPKFCRESSWERAQGLFDREQERIVKAVDAVPINQLDTRVLVSGVRGIEDSSRFWSVNLTLEHLIIVNDGMSYFIVELSHGRVPPVKIGIADVKPSGRSGVSSELPSYQASALRLRTRVTKEVKDRESQSKLSHPWFGPLTPYQWVCLAAIHQGIHRRQIEAIIKGL